MSAAETPIVTPPPLPAKSAFEEKVDRERARIEKGGAPKYHAKNAETGKLFARERIKLLVDEGSFGEDGAFANALDPEAKSVITETQIGLNLYLSIFLPL